MGVLLKSCNKTQGVPQEHDQKRTAIFVGPKQDDVT